MNEQQVNTTREAREWAKKVRNDARARIQMLGIRGTGQLLRQLKYRVKGSSGSAEKVSFIFPREGIFVHLGVGRGYILHNKKLVRGSTTHGPYTRFNQAGGLKREPKPWLGPAIEENMEELARIISVEYAEKTINVIKP